MRARGSGQPSARGHGTAQLRQAGLGRRGQRPSWSARRGPGGLNWLCQGAVQTPTTSPDRSTRRSSTPAPAGTGVANRSVPSRWCPSGPVPRASLGQAASHPQLRGAGQVEIQRGRVRVQRQPELCAGGVEHQRGHRHVYGVDRCRLGTEIAGSALPLRPSSSAKPVAATNARTTESRRVRRRGREIVMACLTVQ
jgi:hypothetical protein